MKIEKKDLNLYDTIFSGQCFRMEEEKDKSYTIVLKDRVINIQEEDKYLIIDSNVKKNLKEVVIDYFDLNRDYNEINSALSKEDEFMKRIILKCSGYKILKQNPFEMIISYIISQNNNVRNISRSIRLICENYGERQVFRDKEYYLFPNFDKLKDIKIHELRSFGVGFRDVYIISILEYIKRNPDFIERLKIMNTEDALSELLKIKGIGPKVASCILLFGYGKLDVYPIDTWVKKNIEENYKNVKNNIKYIEEFACKKFGIYSGIAIQYMFHYSRNASKKD